MDLVPCCRMHGLGNDYVFFQQGDVEGLVLADLARAACHRQTGPGGDGIILLGIEPDGVTSFSIINADGTHAELCGNGLRCAAAIVSSRLGGTSEVQLKSAVGLHQMTVDLQSPGLWSVCGPLAIPAFGDDFELLLGDKPIGCQHITIGNPHAVAFIDDPVDAHQFETMFMSLQRMPRFPNGANLHLARVRTPNRITMSSWERGAGPTQACATGAAAVAVAAHAQGAVGDEVGVGLPGGDLTVRIGCNDEAVVVEGPAVFIADLHWQPASIKA